MSNTAAFALCADDYGLSYGVSVGVLKALEAGRLSAVSALVNGPRWPAMGRELTRRRHDADIGLHFNLTLGSPVGPMPAFAPSGEFPQVGAVIKQGLRGKLPLVEIEAELDRQLDRFEAVMERRPDFIDGHQHVHALPGVREAFLTTLEKRGLAGAVWLRDCGDQIGRILFRGHETRKALAVRSLSGGFRRLALSKGFRLNDGFAGFSSFNPGVDYAAQFATYLRRRGARHLIMCHPGHVDDDLRALDPVTVTREQELAFLLSPRFTELLEKRGLSIERL